MIQLPYLPNVLQLRASQPVSETMITETTALMTQALLSKQLSLKPSSPPKPEQKYSPTFYLGNTEINSTHVSPSESFARNWSWEMLANLFSSCSTCHWKNDLPSCVVFLATFWCGSETFKAAKEMLRSRLPQILLGAKLKFWAWELTSDCGWALVSGWRGAEMFSEPSESLRREEKLCEGQYCSSWLSKVFGW